MQDGEKVENRTQRTPPSKEKIGGAVLQARRERELSQRELANRVKKPDGTGISAQHLSDIERGRRTPGPHILWELSAALELDPDYLCFLSGRIPRDLTEGEYDRETVITAMQSLRERLRARAPGGKKAG